MNHLYALPTVVSVKLGLSPAISKGITWGLQGIGTWPAPPNWDAADWRMELQAIAIATALDAAGSFDSARGVPLSGYVSQRVKARTLTRYRQEWRYALKTKITEPGHMEELAGSTTGIWPSRGVLDSVQWALNRLEEPERWLLQQIFWHQRTEAIIAAELQVTQPAINKRKHQALARLRLALGEEDRAHLAVLLPRAG